MKHTLIGLGVLTVLGVFFGLHRIAVWAERRGWIYYRTKRGSSGALGNALLAAQAILEPSTKHVLEERMKDALEAQETGEPPDPGKSAGDPS